MSITRDGFTVTRHVCPRNCYDACGILAYTRAGRLVKVTGDPDHGFTRGKLCAKGYGYVRQVYHPERLRFPLRRIGRSTDRWEVISWDEALNSIAHTILDIKSKYNSTLPLCLNKYSGNFGILHYAVEGLFNSLGPTTQAIGSPCWSAGLEAQYYDMGDYISSDPQEMTKARLLILWGVNPAWTSVHSLPYIYQGKEHGATLIVIDPVLTETAKKADIYVQVKPGEDGALALAIAKILYENNLYDHNFVSNHTFGWEKFVSYLETLCLDDLSKRIGQPVKHIDKLARLFAERHPTFIWAGFGLQRHINGGQNLRAIDALAAMTGNIGSEGGGVHYAHQQTWGFSYQLKNIDQGNRYININNFAASLKALESPPVKLLWVSCRNMINQDVNSQQLLKQLEKMSLIVAVDQFLTPTAKQADLVLPATTHFEEIDVVPSYWHYWLSLNEQAIKPWFEAKSDLAIAQALARRLNELAPGSSSFPVDRTAEQLLDSEFNPSLYDLFQMNHWSDLRDKPRRAQLPATARKDRIFPTPSGMYEFYSARAKAASLPAMPIYRDSCKPDKSYPYRFITPHAQHRLNSQFSSLSWLDESVEPSIYIHPATAEQHKLASGQTARIFNSYGSIRLKVKLSCDIAPDTLVCYQGWAASADQYLNSLIPGFPTDMGKTATGATGLAFYDVFVNLEKI